MSKLDLTAKEHAYLTDSLELENLCIAKYDFYADQCQDAEIRDLIGSIVDTKRQHASRLRKLVKPRTSYTGFVKYQ